MSQTAHRYPLNWLMADYVRGGAGFALTAAPLVLVEPTPVFAVILAGLAATFALFLARTVARQRTIFLHDGEGVSQASPFTRTRYIAWRDLRSFSLNYYSTQRNREKGWLLLTLKAADGTALQMESPLSGFRDLTELALEAVKAGDVPLSQTTVDNMRSAGYRLSAGH